MITENGIKFNEHFNQDAIKVYRSWLGIENKLDFKLMIALAELEDGNMWEGRIKTLVDLVYFNDNAANRKNLKLSLNRLCENGYIDYYTIGYNHYITIIPEEDYRYFKYDWIETLRGFNKDDDNKNIDKKLSVDWSNLIKIVIFSIFNQGKLLTRGDISMALTMSDTVVSKCYSLLVDYIDLYGLTVLSEKKYGKAYNSFGYKCIGSEVGVGLAF